MKRAILERNLVVILFIMVLIAFSFADRDSKKLDSLYKVASNLKKKTDVAISSSVTSQKIEKAN